jgi:hypothetical protein
MPVHVGADLAGEPQALPGLQIPGGRRYEAGERVGDAVGQAQLADAGRGPSPQQGAGDGAELGRRVGDRRGEQLGVGGRESVLFRPRTYGFVRRGGQRGGVVGRRRQGYGVQFAHQGGRGLVDAGGGVGPAGRLDEGEARGAGVVGAHRRRGEGGEEEVRQGLVADPLGGLTGRTARAARPVRLHQEVDTAAGAGVRREVAGAPGDRVGGGAGVPVGVRNEGDPQGVEPQGVPQEVETGGGDDGHGRWLVGGGQALGEEGQRRRHELVVRAEHRHTVVEVPLDQAGLRTHVCTHGFPICRTSLTVGVISAGPSPRRRSGCGC